MKRKTLWILIALLSVAILSFIGPYIVMNLPFEYGGDLKPSWYEFYTEMQNLISLKAIFLNGRFPFYSWDLFLGNNFWASKGFYGLSDLFNYITLWLPVHFYVVFEIHIVLKVITAGVSFFYFIQNFSTNQKANLISALTYALSSWFIFFIGQLTFASFYALFPLYLWGLESYLTKDKKLLFILSTALLLFTNYYLFFSVSIFTVIYYLYRYSLLKESFKSVFKDTLWIIFYYAIGALITSVITIPTFTYMLGSDRVGGFLFNLDFYSLKIYLHQLVATLVPTHVYIYDGNAFETGVHTTRELLLWSSSLTAILVPQVFMDNDKRFKRNTLIVYLILVLILISPLGGSIMHGFSEASFRWTFLFITFNIVTANRYLSNLDQINVNVLKATLVFIVLALILVLPLNLYVEGHLSTWLSQYSTITIFYGLSIVMFSVVYVLLVKRPSKVYTWLTLLTFLELTAYASYNLVYNRMNTNFTWDFTNHAVSVLQSTPNEFNNYLNSLDPDNTSEYYRVYVPHESLYWSYSHNMSIHYQLQGLMTYDSTYSPSFNDLKKIAPQVKDFDSNWIFNIKDPNLVDFLNVKYAVVVDESELPHDDFTLISDTYRGSLKIYENNRYRTLGTTYTQIMTYEILEKHEKNDTSILNDWLVVHDEDFQTISNYLQSSTVAQLENISHYDNQLMGTITSDKPSFMVITLPYDEGWKITLNGHEVQKYQVNGGFIGIPVEAGVNELHMQFVPYGFKIGFILSGIGVLLGILIWVNEKKAWFKKN